MRKPAKKAVRKAVKRPAKTVKKKPAKARKRASQPSRPKLFAKIVPPQIPLEAPSHDAPADTRLPAFYGETKMALLVRDPWWLFAYWEVTQARHDEVLRALRSEGHREWKTVLRVHDLTGGTPDKPRSFFDIELNFYADNWYIDVGQPDHEWMAQIGFRAANGRFFVLVESNRVRTPSFGISDVLDEEWMLPEDIYHRLIGLSGLNAQRGSMDIRKLLEKYLKRLISSERLPQAPQKS